VLIDLVLAGDGAYWRKRVELSATPPRGETLVLVTGPEVVGVVVGCATPVDGDGTVASVLLRASTSLARPEPRDGLRREGWRPLL